MHRLYTNGEQGQDVLSCKTLSVVHLASLQINHSFYLTDFNKRHKADPLPLHHPLFIRHNQRPLGHPVSRPGIQKILFAPDPSKPAKPPAFSPRRSPPRPSGISPALPAPGISPPSCRRRGPPRRTAPAPSRSSGSGGRCCWWCSC